MLIGLMTVAFVTTAKSNQIGIYRVELRTVWRFFYLRWSTLADFWFQRSYVMRIYNCVKELFSIVFISQTSHDYTLIIFYTPICLKTSLTHKFLRLTAFCLIPNSMHIWITLRLNHIISVTCFWIFMKRDEKVFVLNNWWDDMGGVQWV